jgi:hypothetical protein
LMKLIRRRFKQSTSWMSSLFEDHETILHPIVSFYVHGPQQKLFLLASNFYVNPVQSSTTNHDCFKSKFSASKLVMMW